MKTIELKRFFRLKAAVLATGTALCGILGMASCTDEVLSVSGAGESDGSLRFTVTEQGSWNPGTRSSSTGAPASATVQMTGSDKPLFLHMSETERTGGSGATLTRGTIREEANFYDTFTLFAYAYSADEGFSETESTPNYLYDAYMKRDSKSGTYIPENGPYFIPGKGTDLMLFAMAPSDPFNRDKVEPKPAADSKGTPQFTFACPWYSVNQSDVCLIKGTEVKGGTENGNITLNFQHIFTSIRIVADSDMEKGTIKHIGIKGVHGVGIFTPSFSSEPNNPAGTWQLTDNDLTSTYYAYNHDEGKNQMNVPVGNGKDVEVTGDETGTTFFMIPQTLGDDALLEVTFIHDGETESETFTAKLTGQEWKMGYTVTYRISHVENDKIIVEINDSNGSSLANKKVGTKFNGGELVFKVKSMKGDQKINHSIQFSTDGGKSWSENTAGSRPGMIASTTKTDNNDGTWTHSIKIPRGQTIVEGSDVTALINKGWREDVGLVNGNTANCYIVPSAGTYRFMAVYGNAIKNNVTNSAVMGKYQNGAGETINSPYLPDGITAKLIWEDVDGLISNTAVTGSGNNKRITFTVGGSRDIYQDIIQPGNALIGAYKNGKVIWSWHIWVTPDPGSGTVKNATFMKNPVGFVRGGMTKAKARSCLMRAYVEDTDGTVYSDPVTIEQSTDGYTPENKPGRYPTYQWGRKEPMWPSSSDFNQQAGSPLYGPGAPTEIQAMSLNQAARISNPTTFNSQDDNSNLNANLWNAAATGQGETTGPVTKSIYDPCPPGYHVAADDAFKNMTQSGGDFSASGGSVTGLTNAKLDVDVEFGITYSKDSNGGVFVPFAGCRLPPSFLFLNSEYFYYGGSWTAGRGTRQGNIRSALFYQIYDRSTGNMVMVLPNTLKTSFTIAADGATYCWPVLPQRE